MPVGISTRKALEGASGEVKGIQQFDSPVRYNVSSFQHGRMLHVNMTWLFFASLATVSGSGVRGLYFVSTPSSRDLSASPEISQCGHADCFALPIEHRALHLDHRASI
jgi:hypothetical protein